MIFYGYNALPVSALVLLAPSWPVPSTYRLSCYSSQDQYRVRLRPSWSSDFAESLRNGDIMTCVGIFYTPPVAECCCWSCRGEKLNDAVSHCTREQRSLRCYRTPGVVHIKSRVVGELSRRENGDGWRRMTHRLEAENSSLMLIDDALGGIRRGDL